MNMNVEDKLSWLKEGCRVLKPGGRAVITAAGFAIEVWNDRTDLARQAFANVQEPVGVPALPVLDVYMLVGRDIPSKAYSLHRNLDEERVSLIETVAVKPDS
jgi:hypothetical protein